jgi:hypothetical protein
VPVRATSGELLGIKPGEYELVEEQMTADFDAEVQRLIAVHQGACMRMLGTVPYWTVLVTADDACDREVGVPVRHEVCLERVQRWMDEFFLWPRILDNRGNTWRLQVFAEPDDPTAVVKRAVDAAKKHDVTLQLLCCYEPIEGTEEKHDLGGRARVTVRDVHEEYPVLYLASSGKGWEVP